MPFLFNTQTGRFTDTRTGRFLSRQDVLDIVEGRIVAGQEQLDLMLDGLLGFEEVTLADFQAAMMQELKRAHLQTAALGKGGWSQMTPSDYGKVGATLRSEYAYLRDFMEEINQGNLSERAVRDRMKMYQSAIWQSYWQGARDAMLLTGATHERRIAIDDEGTCQDCRALAARGWATIGTLPLPGNDSQCLSRCRCWFVFGRQSGRTIRQLTE